MGFLHSLSLPPLSTFGSANRERPAVKQTESERRRSLIQTVLAEVMRKQGIPHDWITCHTLGVPRQRGGKSKVVVLFEVNKGDDQVVPLVHAFQDNFRRAITRYDITAPDWIAAISWEFLGDRDPRFAEMPAPGTWSQDAHA